MKVECPMCEGSRSCRECDGLGEAPCPSCGGEDGGCEQCADVGRYVCLPCDGTGVCPRCKGEGRLDGACEFTAYLTLR